MILLMFTFDNYMWKKNYVRGVMKEVTDEISVTSFFKNRQLVDMDVTNNLLRILYIRFQFKFRFGI